MHDILSSHKKKDKKEKKLYRIQWEQEKIKKYKEEEEI